MPLYRVKEGHMLRWGGKNHRAGTEVELPEEKGIAWFRIVDPVAPKKAAKPDPKPEAPTPPEIEDEAPEPPVAALEGDEDPKPRRRRRSNA